MAWLGCIEAKQWKSHEDAAIVADELQATVVIRQADCALFDGESIGVLGEATKTELLSHLLNLSVGHGRGSGLGGGS